MTEIPIREAFTSRRDAEAARDRLEYGGFAPSRVQLLRIGDEFVVIIYAEPEEREHAQDLINKTGWLPDWASSYGRRVAEHAPTPTQSLLGLALIAGAGAALYWAFSQAQEGGRRRVRYQGGSTQTRPELETRERPTAADLYRRRDQSSGQRAEAANPTGTRTIEGSDSTEAQARPGSPSDNLRWATGTASSAVE
jgi:hypothetical protein